MATIKFMGAAGTVTGSRYLLEHDGKKLLIDCGMFQGRRELRERNWEPWPEEAKKVDAVVLTHAHIDHTGGLPRLVREGYRGPVYSTPGTRDLCALLLPDSARIQEEEARYANKEGYSKHKPALPLYTEVDARAALRLFESFGYERTREIVPGITLRFLRAGHILGSAICIVELASSKQRVVFSGDVGRYDAPILKDPQPVELATTLLAECTYGDRTHGDMKPMDALADAVNDVVKRGGVMVVPAFAVGRTQELLYHLGNLERAHRIPELPVFVDSPMACDATPIYLAHHEDHDLEMQALEDGGFSPLQTKKTRFTTTVNESKSINQLRGPGIVLSASGMATAGRILHHLKHRLPGANNTVLFVGYQSEGTRGRRILEGEQAVRIHGQMVPVKAKVTQISGFSAHADWKEMMRWMGQLTGAPKQVLLVHGEEASLAAMKQRVEGLGWPAYVPKHMETVEVAKA